MNKDDFNFLLPLSNIFSAEENRIQYLVATLIIIASVYLSSFLIFGFITVIFLSFIFIILALFFLAFQFKVRRSSKLKIDNVQISKMNFRFYSINTNFSWYYSVTTIRENLKALSEIKEILGDRFWFLTIPRNSIPRHIKKGKIQESLENLVESIKTVTHFDSYLITENSEISDQTVFISSLKFYGLNVKEIEGEAKIDVINSFISHRSENMKKSMRVEKKYRTYLRMVQKTDQTHFQISRFMNGYDIPVSTLVSVNKILKGSGIISRQISSLFAKERILGDRKKSTGEELNLKIHAAEYIRRDKNKYLYNVETIFGIEENKSYSLARRIKGLKSYGDLWGIRLKELDHRNLSISNFIGKNSTSIYPQTLDKLTAFFPFLVPKTNNGIPLGTHDPDGNFIYFNPFEQSSYNILTLGETGSGKSFFSKILLNRLLMKVIVKRILILDVLNEYNDEQWKNIIRNDIELGAKGDFVIEIIKVTSNENAIEYAKKFMMQSQNERTIIAIEEGHTFLRNNTCSEILVEMVKTSRHYNTSILIVSQDSSDFLTENGKKILNNTISTFIFRNKLAKNLSKFGIDFASYGYSESQTTLAGGKNLPYSECLFYSLGELVKLKILPTEWEKENFV
jgi:hypothetical protein